MDQAGAQGRRIAFFGGSFDPPHLGHLAVARAAREALALDTVLFAPVGAQPLKPLGSCAGFEDRLAMTRLAIAGVHGFAVSLADAPKPDGRPNYTLETLVALRDELPTGSRLFCLMGADSFVGLRSWHRSTEIPFAAPLIVASRPGQQLDDLRAALPAGLWLEGASPGAVPCSSGVEVRCWQLRNQAGDAAPFYLLPGVNVEISASEIREQVGAARSSLALGHELLPDSVTAYIRSQGLYQ